MVKSINNVKCAAEGGGPIPSKPPQFADFFQLALSVRELQERDLLEVGRIEFEEPLIGRVNAETLTAAESRAATEAGYTYQESENPGELTLSRTKQVSVLRFSPKAVGTPEHELIVKLLNLDPSLLEYKLRPAFQST